MPSETPEIVTLLQKVETTASHVVELATGVACAFSSRRPNSTSDNEDAAAIAQVDEHRAVLVVADGIGGQAGGAQASTIAVETIVQSARTVTESESLRTRILDGFEKANIEICGLGIGAATTLAVVEIDRRTVRPYHAGDSEILIVGQRGKVKLQTVSHAPVAYAVESGLIDRAEAIHHEDRHLITNMIGSPDMRIEIGAPVTLADRDSVLLATDGVFDNLHQDEIINLIRTGELARVGQSLYDVCRKRMVDPESDHPSKPDDLAFVLFRPAPQSNKP